MPILHWLNDEEARKTSSRVPYRLLEADETLSYGDPNSENMLIQGDNLVHDTWAFRLPLSNGKFFYPDFVALLNDGRILVVEYKGEHLVEYSQEKKNIGEKWEEASNDRALFIMAVRHDEKGRDIYRQIDDKVK